MNSLRDRMETMADRRAAAFRLTAQDEKRIVAKRIQRGECPVCAIKLFKIGLMGKKAPIPNRVTTAGSCRACLDEKALEKVPRILEVNQSHLEADDNASTLSGITLPIDLVMAARMIESSQVIPTVIEQSDGLGHVHEIAIDFRGHDDDLANLQDGVASPRNKGFTPPPSLLQQTTLAAVQRYSDSDELDFPLSIAWEPANLHVVDEDTTVSTIPAPPPVSPIGRRQNQDNGFAFPWTHPEIHVDTTQPGDIYVEWDSPRTDWRQPDAEHGATWNDSPRDTSPRSPRSALAARRNIVDTAPSLPHQQSSQILDAAVLQDIKGCIQTLSSTPTHDRTTRVAALKTITTKLFQSTDARQELEHCRGLQAIPELMWSDIGDAILQEAALTVLFALVVSSEGDSIENVWTGDDAQACIDASLVSMQTLIGNATIQSIGCKVFGCLAKAVSINDRVNDGSLSGAVSTVLTALQVNETSQDVQEWGVRALYNFCVYSKHGQANKRAICASTLQNGETGATVIIQALRRSSASPALCEWVCKLYQQLSMNVNATRSQVQDGVKVLLQTIWLYHKDASSITLLEAALGAAADSLQLEGVRDAIHPRTTLEAGFRVIHRHRSHDSVLMATFEIITRLCEGRRLNDAVNVEARDLLDLYDTMFRFPKSPTLHVAALGAATALATCSGAVRDMLLEPMLYARLMQLRPIFQGPSEADAMSCHLAACLLEGVSTVVLPVISDIVESILTTVSRHVAAETVADAACLALSKALANKAASSLCVSEILDQALNVMERFASSDSIQSSCCSIISQANPPLGAHNDKAVFRHGRFLVCLSSAVQNHSSVVSVLDGACDALSWLVTSSAAAKSLLLSDSEGIEAIRNIRVNHSTYPGLCAKAAQILARLEDDDMTSVGMDTILSQNRSARWLS